MQWDARKCFEYINWSSDRNGTESICLRNYQFTALCSNPSNVCRSFPYFSSNNWSSQLSSHRTLSLDIDNAAFISFWSARFTYRPRPIGLLVCFPTRAIKINEMADLVYIFVFVYSLNQSVHLNNSQNYCAAWFAVSSRDCCRFTML